ncbi:F-actin-capping protein subunit beta [Paraphysoderma sedebokerense]|nr:F-actin-capping protein subunit beta [Paraphysoderma sedebokerense]
MSQLDSAHDLMRRLPPQNVEANLIKLIDVVPDLTEDLLSAVDTPLKIQKCKATGRDYLLCDYNRDGDSYRSPWSNEYDPPLPDGAVPSQKLRKLEVAANDAFDTYREMYYEGGISSVYMWDLDDGFAAVVLIKKVNDNSATSKATWDSIHVLEVQDRGRSAHYKLTSTILLYMVAAGKNVKELNLGGSLTRQTATDLPIDSAADHLPNIGRLIEDLEIKMRNTLSTVYFEKTKDITNDLRSFRNLNEVKGQMGLQKMLVGGLLGRVGGAGKGEKVEGK